MPEHCDGGRAERVAEFQEWVREVRDPAKLGSEGLRVVNACERKATAEYEIALLPCGQYAVRFSCSYQCGNGSGHARLWTEFRTREACVDHFVAAARQHFQPECQASNCNDLQKTARKQMLQLLNGGLFGFVEPEPEAQDCR